MSAGVYEEGARQRHFPWACGQSGCPEEAETRRKMVPWSGSSSLTLLWHPGPLHNHHQSLFYLHCRFPPVRQLVTHETRTAAVLSRHLGPKWEGTGSMICYGVRVLRRQPPGTPAGSDRGAQEAQTGTRRGPLHGRRGFTLTEWPAIQPLTVRGRGGTLSRHGERNGRLQLMVRHTPPRLWLIDGPYECLVWALSRWASGGQEASWLLLLHATHG